MSTTEYRKLDLNDLPFDLNNLFHLQYSFDVLKKAIEYLGNQQTMIKARVNDMGDKISQGALNSGSQPTARPERKKTIKPAAEGEAVSSGVTLEMFENLEDMVYSIDHTNRINNLENQMRILKKMGAPSTGSGGGKGGPDLLDAFNEILDKNKAEFDQKIDDLKEELQKNSGSEYKAQIDDLKLLQAAHQKHIMNLQLDADLLKKNKTNQTDFEEKVKEIEEFAEILEKKFDKIPKITEGDIERWNETISGLHTLTERVDKLCDDTSDLQKIRDRQHEIQSKLEECVTDSEFKKMQLEISNIAQSVKFNREDVIQNQKDVAWMKDHLASQEFAPMDEFVMVRNRIEISENQINHLRKMIVEVDKKHQKFVPTAASGSGDSGMFHQLMTEIQKLRTDFESHKKYANRNLDYLVNQMPLKADKNDMIDLEHRLHDQIGNLKHMLNYFANREEMMKRFAQLSKKIRDILELLSKQGPRETMEDAMLTKKPFGPLQCASCEKDIVNLQGQPVDYTVWKKLPFRGQAETIARYGRGFSKTLSMLKPEHPDGHGYESDSSPYKSKTQLPRHTRNASLDEANLPTTLQNTNADRHANEDTTTATMAQAQHMRQGSLPHLASQKLNGKGEKEIVYGNYQ